jgi:hypothetical protein
MLSDAASDMIAATGYTGMPHLAYCNRGAKLSNSGRVADGWIVARVGHHYPNAGQGGAPSDIAVPAKWETENPVEPLPAAEFKDMPREGRKPGVSALPD